MADSSGSSPGAILKRCREYHGLSMEEAEEATKIGGSYLKALEEDQISQFASLTYLKGFLRIYATYLGLNPDDMIRLYDKLYASKNGRNNNSEDTVAADRPHRKKFPLQKLVLPTVLLLLILITAAIVNRSSAPPAHQNIPAPVAQPAAAPAIQQVHSSVHTVSPASIKDESVPKQTHIDPQSSLITTQKPAQENPKGFIVRLKVIHSGTLTVAIDSASSQAYDLAVGDNIEWKGEHTMTLELSNAGGVEAELNGKPLKPFGPVGKPATIVLGSEGIRP